MVLFPLSSLAERFTIWWGSLMTWNKWLNIFLYTIDNLSIRLPPPPNVAEVPPELLCPLSSACMSHAAVNEKMDVWLIYLLSWPCALASDEQYCRTSVPESSIRWFPEKGKWWDVPPHCAFHSNGCWSLCPLIWFFVFLFMACFSYELS